MERKHFMVGFCTVQTDNDRVVKNLAIQVNEWLKIHPGATVVSQSLSAALTGTRFSGFLTVVFEMPAGEV